MTKDEIASTLENYCSELVSIWKRFKTGPNGIYMLSTDSSRFHGIVTEVSHLFEDHLPMYSGVPTQLANAVANGRRAMASAAMCTSVLNVEAIVRPYVLRVSRQGPAQPTPQALSTTTSDRFSDLLRIVERFDTVARQLQKRYDDRSTLLIQDEYDAQDLFRALLAIYFDDVRSEQTGPSYIGGSARVDFVLPEIETFVELKKTRVSMSTKALGEQIIVDISRYRAHQACKRIAFFIYDPEYLVINPAGLESDVRKESSDIDVRIFISPRR